jgi:hypothetical protein
MHDSDNEHHDHEACPIHDHDHGHGHNHEHGYGHDRDHEHGHGHDHSHSDSVGLGEVIVSTHEGASIGSLELSGSEDATAEEKRIIDRIDQLAKRVEAEGGTIGHIKGAVTQDGSVLLVSSTAARNPAQVVRHELPGYQVEVVAIVFGIEPEQLRTMMNELFL